MGRTVLITGATRNTGLAIAEKFAQKGYHVVITGRNESDNLRTQQALSQKYPAVQIRSTVLQLSDTESIASCVAFVKENFGTLDALVLNAIHPAMNTNILNVTPEDYHRVMLPNLCGNFFLCQKASGIMPRGSAICIVSSVHANQCVPNRILYSMTKAALNAMSRSMSIELAHKGIRSNAVNAGAIWTERWANQSEEETHRRRAQYPAGRESTPEEIANGVYFLCDPENPTVTGTELTIDSGVTTGLLSYDANWHLHVGAQAGGEHPRP